MSAFYPASRVLTGVARARSAPFPSVPAFCRAHTVRRFFTRGETQALVVATLGSDRDNQKIDSLNGEQFDGFMFHYNMPPYATGETGRSMGPKRREIGQRPSGQNAAYWRLCRLRNNLASPCVLVSEITESNGSSSMASVCGGSLALMDAGVPVSAHVSGIAMGLITDGERFSVLSDILGDEDHLGDMDFKVAGTRGGITALQMDLKSAASMSKLCKPHYNKPTKDANTFWKKWKKYCTTAQRSVSVCAAYAAAKNPR